MKKSLPTMMPFGMQTGLVDGPCALADLPWGHAAQTSSQGSPQVNSPEAALDACGAECMFVGRTRAEIHPEFGQLIHLDYEAYAPMVEKHLEQMAEQAVEQFDCRWVHLIHSQGVVPIGQPSVVIQVACGHRGDSFVACRFLIEEVKRVLPVWKREVWERGETYVQGWQANQSDG